MKLKTKEKQVSQILNTHVSKYTPTVAYIYKYININIYLFIYKLMFIKSVFSKPYKYKFTNDWLFQNSII